MNTILIFLPHFLKNFKDGFLFGTFHSNKSNAFYILGIFDLNQSKTNKYSNIIGCQNLKDEAEKKNSNKFWISFILHNDLITFKHIIIDNEDILLSKSKRHVILIEYNFNIFAKSEMFYMYLNNSENKFFNDQFQILWKQVKAEKDKNTRYNLIFYKILHIFLFLLHQITNIISKIINILMPFFRYSTLFLHVDGSLKSFKWALESYLKKEHLSIKISNYLVSNVFDIFLGIIVLYYFMPLYKHLSPANQLLEGAQVVVENLSNLLEWLMGSPAGLKLNHAFSKTLGMFFLYHIQLWWIFLEKCTPILYFTFNIFYWFGHLGLSFQLSILSDILGLVGFHVYCIYVYAAKLYHLQIYILISLSRLFLGKKYNPLRRKVDSCEYSPDQLFVGTLAFTILLFLLPTTSVYYVVFTSMRLCMVFLGGLLTRLKFFLQAFPLLITFFWIFRSPKLTSSIKLSVETRPNFIKNNLSSTLGLSVKPVVGSWTYLMVENIPDTIIKPPNIKWGSLVHKIVFGELVYPF